MVVAGSPDQRHWIRGCCDLTMRLGKVEAGVFLKKKFGHRRDAKVKTTSGIEGGGVVIELGDRSGPQ